jgi:glucoamylase
MGQMLPEQVWDEPNLPGARLQLGKPAGSAVPLVWAHAEYLKLLRSALDGKVFDRIEPVYARYSEPEGRQRLRRDLQMYTFRRPIQRIPAGSTLRIIDVGRFRVTWSVDQWKTVHTTESRSLGSAGHGADISTLTAPEGGALSWTLQWTEQGRWLGHNVDLKIEPAQPTGAPGIQ